ncbi:hypothetical protein [Edaphobacter modestus]|uniref:hypothetical protein n=1 Tax=Edaphobacter modestus TaxID=388466 RepID=UPI001F5F94C9|nr:hypothetical protein [Edaphobacter modestus]
MSDQNGNNPTLDVVSRGSFLGVGSAALATVAMAGLTAHAHASSSSAASNTASASAGWAILPAALMRGATPKATSRESGLHGSVQHF